MFLIRGLLWYMVLVQVRGILPRPELGAVNWGSLSWNTILVAIFIRPYPQLAFNIDVYILQSNLDTCIYSMNTCRYIPTICIFSYVCKSK